MSYLLEAPTAVVVVGSEESVGAVRARLDGTAVTDVYHDPTGEEIVGRAAVGCLVVTGDGSTALEHARHFATADQPRPVVAYLDTAEASLIAWLSQTGASVVLDDG